MVLKKKKKRLVWRRQHEQYKAIFYEDLHDDQRGVLRDIEGFLGIAPFDYPQAALDRRVTESKKREMPEFFADLVSGDIARIRKEVEDEGYVLPLSWG